MSAEVMSTLSRFFAERLSLPVPPPDAPLTATGFVASMHLLELVSFIEEELKVELSAEDVTPQNLETLSAVAKVVSARKGAG